MKREILIFFMNLISLILALEIRAFFEKGGGTNELAISIMKILFLSFISVCIINLEEVTRVIIHKIDQTVEEGNYGGIMSITKLLRNTTKNTRDKHN